MKMNTMAGSGNNCEVYLKSLWFSLHLCVMIFFKIKSFFKFILRSYSWFLYFTCLHGCAQSWARAQLRRWCLRMLFWGHFHLFTIQLFYPIWDSSSRSRRLICAFRAPGHDVGRRTLPQSAPSLNHWVKKTLTYSTKHAYTESTRISTRPTVMATLKSTACR